MARMAHGRLFQSRGAALENAFSPCVITWFLSSGEMATLDDGNSQLRSPARHEVLGHHHPHSGHCQEQLPVGAPVDQSQDCECRCHVFISLFCVVYLSNKYIHLKMHSQLIYLLKLF